MSMSTGGGKPGGLQSEINVTPLIDVLLVLLIIFLVVMPIMMKMETLEVPRNIDTEQEMPDPNASQLTVFVKPDLSIDFSDGLSENPTPISASDLVRTLRPKLEAMASNGNAKVVFVDFDPTVPWKEVVGTMDQIRALAADVNHDEIKVALKVKDADLRK
ncbi:MAG: biopolymer transporter ExbD [Deltaproteobacteria bacterium]|nr:biopolymer transporter ExbD [Deltaproteobacteria bacterium]